RGAPSSGQRCSGRGFDRLKIEPEMAPSAAALATALSTRLSAMRISVRPFAVIWATTKAISTKVHSTTSSAKPRLRPGTAGNDGRGTGSETVRVGKPRFVLVLQLLRDQCGIAQLTAQVFGQCPGVALVVDDVRRDQHQKLGAVARVG